MGGAVIGAIATVNYAIRQPKTPEVWKTTFTTEQNNIPNLQQKGDKNKMNAMFWHKSFGLFIAIALPVRFAARFASKIPAALPSPLWQKASASVSHLGLYAGMVFMAATGVGMGYNSGKGLPFFTTTLDLKPAVLQPEVAKWYYLQHKQIGYYWQFLVPLHVAGTGLHVLKGQKIFSRMNPFN